MTDTGAREPLDLARESLHCLRLEVPDVVWQDVNEKVEAAFAALAAGVGVPPDADLVSAPHKEREDARGPVHLVDAGRYYAVVRGGVPMIERADTAGAVLEVEA